MSMSSDNQMALISLYKTFQEAVESKNKEQLQNVCQGTYEFLSHEIGKQTINNEGTVMFLLQELVKAMKELQKKSKDIPNQAILHLSRVSNVLEEYVPKKYQ